MSKLAKKIVSNIVGLVSRSIDKKIDLYPVGLELDKKLDQALGERISEKLQRGIATNSIVELLQGLWSESPEALGKRLITEGNKMLKK